jgi:hypothetical protein
MGVYFQRRMYAGVAGQVLIWPPFVVANTPTNVPVRGRDSQYKEAENKGLLNLLRGRIVHS